MNEITIERLSPSDIDANLDRIIAVYCAALGEERAAATRRMRDEQLPRHRQREAFRFLVARASGVIVGIAYGYVGARGQWWTERVAAAMSADEQARWLDAPHFEVVELHVEPEWQGRGIGARLLTTLLDGLPVPFALLSTAATNTRGRAFYAREGWAEIVAAADLSSPRGPYVILAKALR